MGKYTYDLGGGFKDDGPGSKLTLFGGYTHIDIAHSSAALHTAPAATPSHSTLPICSPPKRCNFEWAGAKYEFGRRLERNGRFLSRRSKRL